MNKRKSMCSGCGHMFNLPEYCLQRCKKCGWQDPRFVMAALPTEAEYEAHEDFQRIARWNRKVKP